MVPLQQEYLLHHQQRQRLLGHLLWVLVLVVLVLGMVVLGLGPVVLGPGLVVLGPGLVSQRD